VIKKMVDSIRDELREFRSKASLHGWNAPGRRALLQTAERPARVLHMMMDTSECSGAIFNREHE
jgi:hypothetical protein